MAYKKAADGCTKKGKTKVKMFQEGGKADLSQDKKMVAAAIKKHEAGSKAHRAGLKSGGVAKMRKGGACK